MAAPDNINHLEPGAARRSPASRAAAPGSPSTEPQTMVLQQFRIVFNAVKSHWQEVEREAGVGGAQVWALSVIQDSPGIGVSQLAAALSVTQPTASYLVRSLSQQGFVEARRDGPDKRTVQLHTTPNGRKMLRQAPGPFAGVLPAALSQLDEPTLARLREDLQQLIEVLNADPNSADLPLANL
jgi:MarR family transcriptional regulator, organic hydroperoxide resistance regulator